jgi:hypothetical protein
MINTEFELAEQFALFTHKHCFITGKAGTGKTTLLKRIVENTNKKVVVVAPTGVAAINAGGVTIHSMFGLPLTCFIPGNDFVDLNMATNQKRLMHEHIHFRKDKRQVMREMDTLVIDEISMVRCDILDAVDFVMRTVRRNEHPFGDVQVLLFGDMHQLPPVVKDPEWNIMKAYYRSPYFFDSLVWSRLDAAEIELKTVYRQTDTRFLELLSHIRNHKMEQQDYESLRKRYNPDFKATEKGYILLSTHNFKADSVNGSELAKLPSQAYSFEAKIEGEFPEHMFPCDHTLQLKAGAQVMFIRNDTEEGMYYNGKLAVVKRIGPDIIKVAFGEDGRDYELRRETWENIEYSVDEKSGEVIKNELGTFTQFPLRLAWAITIHKSQGLTFDKVIIDAGRSFAPGQVYVALSRCRSLEGIVLHSLIPQSALHSDKRIGAFSAAHNSVGELQDVFQHEKALYANHLLLRLFSFPDLTAHLEEWLNLITKKDVPDKDSANALHAQICGQAKEIGSVTEKFQHELQRRIAALESAQDSTAVLKERCSKAIQYFTEQIANQIIAPLSAYRNELAYKKKVKRYLQQIQLIEDICWNKVDRLYKGRFLDEKLYAGVPVHTKDSLTREVMSNTSGLSNKKEKRSTYRDTLDLHHKGKKVPEIAAIRGLTEGTVKHHLARWIASGEIDIHDVLPAEVIEAVLAFIMKEKVLATGAIRSGLGNKYDYEDIRMIVNHAVRNYSGEDAK